MLYNSKWYENFQICNQLAALKKESKKVTTILDIFSYKCDV